MDQSLEVVGQLGRRRQTRAADEDRDHRDVAVQGPGQLQADIVIGFEQSRGALWGCRGLPARADHHQDGVAAVERPLPGASGSWTGWSGRIKSSRTHRPLSAPRSAPEECLPASGRQARVGSSTCSDVVPGHGMSKMDTPPTPLSSSALPARVIRLTEPGEVPGRLTELDLHAPGRSWCWSVVPTGSTTTSWRGSGRCSRRGWPRLPMRSGRA